MSDGSRPAAGSDEERLPWLEPYREPGAARARRKPVDPPKTAPKPSARRRRAPPFALVGAGMLAAALAGGYWIGTRQAEPPAPPARPATPPPIAEVTVPAPSPLTVPEPTEAAAAEPARVVTAGAPRRHASARRVVRIAAARSRPHPTAAAAAVRVHYGPRAPRYWPYGRMPSPGPAGQVIQLGAFRTPQRAHAAYWRRAGRYPLLTHMPRAVLPVMTRPSGQLLYVLRLGTASRQQSYQVCRNLRASGDHCLIIG